MNFRAIFFFISFLFYFQSQSQEYSYNPFNENNYATFITCVDTSSNLKESGVRTTLMDRLTNALDYSEKKIAKIRMVLMCILVLK